MKVLLVNGSPHKDGCTNEALKEIEKTLNENGIETEIFWVGVKPISGCMGCNQCGKLGHCVFDDVVNEFVDKAESADGFIFGSPVHYASVAGNMSSFMDRVFYSAAYAGKISNFQFKPAAAIASARRAGTTVTLDQLNKYFGITQMPVISSKYWPMVHGHSSEDVRKDEEGLQIMRVLGRNMAFYLKCIEAGKEKGLKYPEQEPSIKTSFIR